jgi:histidyl-tRNA synthetase
LRAAGYAVEYPLTPAKPDKQFKRAQELKVAYTVRLESDAYVRIRNAAVGYQDIGNRLRLGFGPCLGLISDRWIRRLLSFR